VWQGILYRGHQGTQCWCF